MTNAELIKALRYCAIHPFRPCDGCVLFETDGCINVLHGAAADALEAAEKRIAELSLDCEMYQQKCMEIDAKMKTVTNCHTLKEGER